MDETRSESARTALIQDILSLDQPAPEILVRYAEDPEAVEPDQRRLIEEQLARSRPFADQLRILKNFDLGRLDAERNSASQLGEKELASSLLAWLRRFTSALAAPQPAVVWVPAAAAVALIIVIASQRMVTDESGMAEFGKQFAAVQAKNRTLEAELARIRTAEREQAFQLADVREKLARGAAEAPESGQGVAESGPRPREAPDMVKPKAIADSGPTLDPSLELGSAGYQIAMAGTPTYAAPFDAPAGFGAGRFSGVLRSASTDLPTVIALVPTHVARTVDEAPTFYWFLSEATARPISVTVLDPAERTNILTAKIDGPQPAGVAGFSLADHGVKLVPGRIYQWFASVMAGDEPGPEDAIVGGLVQRVPMTSRLEKELRQARAGEAADVYARNGLWYDALAAVSTRLQTEPGNADLRRQRATLLEQVGIDEAAVADR